MDRIMFFEIDSIMNHLLRLHISEPENADEKLVFTDKFYLYRNLWKAILEILYEEFLPHSDYTFEWDIEITPYSIMLCELSKEHYERTEIVLQKQIMNLSDHQIEKEYYSIIEKAGFDKIGLKGVLANRIPDSIIPDTKKEQLALIIRLMNFPPLGELALFINLYNAYLKKQASELSIAFPRIKEKEIPTFEMSESLHYSWFHVDHQTFMKYGLNTFEQHPDLVEHKADFEKIRGLADRNKDKCIDDYICPCCGEKQKIAMPGEILQYKYLLENQALCKQIGLLYLEDFIENFKMNLSGKYYSFLPNINKVDNPDCLILVEGESEESSIPLLAFRSSYILSHHNIHVYNSKSKEKLATDFFSNRANYPNRRIICLLDSDAKKERDDIQRVANKHKDKYRVVFIGRGTFEDIFDLDFSIEILNELYPHGEEIKKEDFDLSKDFLSNTQRLMFQKKKAQFDKVLFAKTISLKMDIDKLPDEIGTIFQIAKDFTASKKYIKK